MSTDPAHLLFPSDAPTQAPDWLSSDASPMASVTVPAALERAHEAMSEDEAAAAVLFKDDGPDPAASISATFEPWAVSAHAGGDPENAAEWREASEILAADFRGSGMDASEIAAVMELTREAQGDTMFGPVTAERLATERARSEAHLMQAGVSDSDLALARRLVNDLDAKMGGKVKAWLAGTGQGNDPRTIQKAIAEAKRRYGG